MLSVSLSIRAVFVSSFSRRFLIAIVEGEAANGFSYGTTGGQEGKRHADGGEDETQRAKAIGNYDKATTDKQDKTRRDIPPTMRKQDETEQRQTKR